MNEKRKVKKKEFVHKNVHFYIKNLHTNFAQDLFKNVSSDFLEFKTSLLQDGLLLIIILLLI